MTRPGGSEGRTPAPRLPRRIRGRTEKKLVSVIAAMQKGSRYLLRPWLAPTSILFGAFNLIYLVGKDGRHIDFLPSGLVPERIIEALRLHLDRQNGP